MPSISSCAVLLQKNQKRNNCKCTYFPDTPHINGYEVFVVFCVYLRPKRIYVILAAVCLFSVLGIALIVAVCPISTPTLASPYVSGDTAAERKAFINGFGWEIEEDPVSVEDVVIPSQFGEVYENYNRLQKEQGYDLLPYAGRTVKKWTYAVTNYPGYAQSAVFVRLTLLVCHGVIIGGDVCSVELDGFMHGFAYETEMNPDYMQGEE